MSGATELSTLTQVPQTQIVSSPSPAPPVAPPVQVPEFRLPLRLSPPLLLASGRHMEASTWLPKTATP